MQLLRIVAWSLIMMGMATVLVGVMRASGTVLAPTGIWWAYVLTFIAALTMQAVFYRVVWRQKRIERMI